MDAIDAAAEKSGELFASGYCCAEAVLMVMAESQGIECELIPRIATGFCGGMARRGEICGALSGAIMGINLVLGRDTCDQLRDKDYGAVFELMKRFEDEFSSVACRDLTGCDLATPEGRQAFEVKNIKERCILYCREAARIAMTEIEKA
jgi:C_GCAxxG_C_C family probable redox protein